LKLESPHTAPPSKHSAEALVLLSKPRELAEVRIEIESPDQFVPQQLQVTRADISIVEDRDTKPGLRVRTHIIDFHTIETATNAQRLPKPPCLPRLYRRRKVRGLMKRTVKVKRGRGANSQRRAPLKSS
jgi:hypothetical protein